MKITASKRTIEAGRREDIIKQRDKWDADFNTKQEQHEAEVRNWRIAQDDSVKSAEAYLESELGKFSALDFDITIDPTGKFVGVGGRREWAAKVDVLCNERDHFAQDKALSWNFDVYLDASGTPVKETGSWSGLQATTAQQLESLKQTLDALTFLNNVDWPTVLNIEVPKYEDYVHTHAPDRGDRPNFEQQLMEVDLEDLVGANKFVKVENWEGSGYRGKYAWVQLVRETPAGYTIRVRGDWGDDDEVRAWLRRAIDQNFATQRMRKSSLKPVMPLQTLDPASDEEFEKWKKAYNIT